MRLLLILATLSFAVPAFAGLGAGDVPLAELESPAATVANGDVLPAALDSQDPLALVSLVVKLLGSRQWLLLVPVLLVLALLGVRRFGAKRWPWLDSPRGGYVLSLVSALALALWAAAASAGGAGVGQVLVAAVLIWIANDKVHEALKGLFWPSGKQRVAQADAAGAALEASAKTPAEKINEAVSG